MGESFEKKKKKRMEYTEDDPQGRKGHTFNRDYNCYQNYNYA